MCSSSWCIVDTGTSTSTTVVVQVCKTYSSIVYKLCIYVEGRPDRCNGYLMCTRYHILRHPASRFLLRRVSRNVILTGDIEMSFRNAILKSRSLSSNVFLKCSSERTVTAAFDVKWWIINGLPWYRNSSSSKVFEPMLKWRLFEIPVSFYVLPF